MQKPQLVSIWEAKRAEGSQIGNHDHNYHELVYYLSGAGETRIAGKRYSFFPNSFGIIPCETEHSEIHNANSEVICLGFLANGDLPFGFYADHTHTIHRILKQLLQETKEQKYGYKSMLTIKLQELLLNIMRSENNSRDIKSFEYIINYIQENLHEHIRLSDCAKQLNISYDYFQHKFKALTGYSPQQFLIQQRLTSAQKLLEEGLHSCTEIAYRCGFSTSAQFSALFKQNFGTTPLEYKRRHSKKA